MRSYAWLLTWTTYGTWLPGDERGFVGYVREQDSDDAEGDFKCRVIHNLPGTPFARNMPGLEQYARRHMKGEAVWLNDEQADILLTELKRTARFHQWQLLAAAVMVNHVHLVVVVPVALKAERLLREFKGYAARALNRCFGKRSSGKWWTASGSTRLLPDERAVRAAIAYVQRQRRPLAVWSAAEYGGDKDGGRGG